MVYTDKASTHDLQQFFSQLGGTVSESEILTDLSAVAVHLFQLQHAVLTFLHTFLNSITKNVGRKESRIVAFKDSVLQLIVILRIESEGRKDNEFNLLYHYIFLEAILTIRRQNINMNSFRFSFSLKLIG